MTRRRVLFMAEAASLAHVGRPAVLAQAIDPGRYEVVFAAHRRVWPLLREVRGQLRSMASASPSAFSAAIAAGRPLFPASTLRRYVAEDLVLLAEVEPDLVIGDLRLSLAVSARLLGIPYAAIANAHWSPGAPAVWPPSPVLPLTRRCGALGRGVVSALMPIGMRLHAREMGAVWREHGLAPPRSLAHLYTDADAVLFADPPGWVDTSSMPSSHHHLGPLLWSPPCPDPPWLAELQRTPGWIYVCLGSTGDRILLPAVIDGLLQLGRPIAVATAGAQLPPRQLQRVRHAPMLPGVAMADGAALVVCNGGAGTGQQALARGVPILGIPGNLDQFLYMRAVVRHGCGMQVRGDMLDARRVRDAAMDLITHPGWSRCAQAMRRHMDPEAAGGRFRAVIDDLLQ